MARDGRRRFRREGCGTGAQGGGLDEMAELMLTAEALHEYSESGCTAVVADNGLHGGTLGRLNAMRALAVGVFP